MRCVVTRAHFVPSAEILFSTVFLNHLVTLYANTSVLMSESSILQKGNLRPREAISERAARLTDVVRNAGRPHPFPNPGL